MENMVQVPFADLQILLFQVYERGNIGTEVAAAMLGQDVGTFVEDFESWQNTD